MLVERSADFGRTWQVYRYFAYDCAASFPTASLGPLRRVDDVIYLLKVTNLRMNLTRLHTLGDNLLDSRREIKEKYYFAVYEMVHGRCVCKHNTKGLNCELCKDFYHDLPWRPAEGRRTNACKKCNCNEHSHRCHFDMAVYLATGNVHGGVCDDCQHNTMGHHCQFCKPFYYKDPTKDIRDPGMCRACDCDPEGTLDGGVCDTHDDPMLGLIAGQCRCKEHVEGPRCDRCKSGFFGLSAENPQGCQQTGQCRCRSHIVGRQCNQVQTGYYRIGAEVIQRVHLSGRPVTWTGLGFARVLEGSVVQFHVNNVPFSMEYDLLLRYEPQLVLVPRYSSLEMFIAGDAASIARKETFERYRCAQQARPVIKGPTPEACANLLTSMSAIIHQGALPCQCDLQGSLSLECNPDGGQCQCKPHVMGRRCERCTPGTFGFGPGGCKLDSVLVGQVFLGLTVTTARLVTGASQTAIRASVMADQKNVSRGQAAVCIAGATRKEIGVRACDCDPRGIEKPQCHRTTGHCSCRPGVSGVRCDQCSRGFAGDFPACQPCHQCFGDWDRIVQDLAAHTRSLMQRAQQLHQTGLAGAFEGPFRRLQDKLSAIQAVVSARNATAATITHLLRNMDDVRVYQSFVQSRKAEHQANASTLAVPSPVSQSAASRRRTEHLMTSRREAFNRQNAANRRGLGDLSTRTRGLSLDQINEKVCGAQGDTPCAINSCGGAGCYDEDGRRHCGGLHCDGAVATADNALDRARHVEEELHHAVSEVESLLHQVSNAKARAAEAKQRAQAALDHANATKARLEHSNKALRDLIQQVKEFLNLEGADPDSIALVASRVLELSIPASPVQIHHLAEEIKERVSSLANVDAILDQTAGDVRIAEQLLQDARRANARAESVKNAAEAVKRALDDAKRAQSAAEKAINSADSDIQHTNTVVNEINRKTANAEVELAAAKKRVGHLDRQVDVLKMKRANNILTATRAEETASAAKNRAEEAEQLEETYEENERLLQVKAAQLDGLEAKMRSILKDINEQIQIYNTCQ
ncbi:hypothetical protein Chor_011410 [Crotalus horridus]